jgi:hypothetical protein
MRRQAKNACAFEGAPHFDRSRQKRLQITALEEASARGLVALSLVTVVTAREGYKCNAAPTGAVD